MRTCMLIMHEANTSACQHLLWRHLHFSDSRHQCCGLKMLSRAVALPASYPCFAWVPSRRSCCRCIAVEYGNASHFAHSQQGLPARPAAP